MAYFNSTAFLTEASFLGARQKLNAAHFTGAVMFAGIIAAASGRWWVFLLVAAVLLTASWIGGELRMGRGGRSDRSR